jgi:hypothetical protein
MSQIICNIHNDISTIASKLADHEINSISKSEPRDPDTGSDDLESLKSEFENYVGQVQDYISGVQYLLWEIKNQKSNIDDLARKALGLGQKMEDGLKARKALMKVTETEIDGSKVNLEDYYQQNKN